jgi:hypothetical protein
MRATDQARARFGLTMRGVGELMAVALSAQALQLERYELPPDHYGQCRTQPQRAAAT